MSLVALFEFGRRGFGGYGQGFFRRAHYVDLADMVRNLHVPKVAETAIVEFVCNSLSRDSYSFNRDKFLNGSIHSRSYPTFEMRHFWYFAECIKHQPPEFREYLAHLFADFFRRKNSNFQSDIWFKECHVKRDGD